MIDKGDTALPTREEWRGFVDESVGLRDRLVATVEDILRHSTNLDPAVIPRKAIAILYNSRAFTNFIKDIHQHVPDKEKYIGFHVAGWSTATQAEAPKLDLPGAYSIIKFYTKLLEDPWVLFPDTTRCRPLEPAVCKLDL